MYYQGNSVYSTEDGTGKMYEKSSFTDGEKQGITITEGEVEEIRQKGENCLIGRY